jgi:hypothetical protein
MNDFLGTPEVLKGDFLEIFGFCLKKLSSLPMPHD